MTQATGYIGFGRVGHERMGEKTHAFEHASYFLMLPLRDMARRGIESLALNRFAPLSFYDEDHGDAESGHPVHHGGCNEWCIEYETHP